MSKESWFAELAAWSARLSTYLDTAIPQDWKLAASYYGGEYCQYVLADYFSNTATYYPVADKFYDAYTVQYLRANGWNLPGYWTFGIVLSERYIRRGEGQSLTDLQLMCANSPYHASGTLLADPVTRHELSREWSYCIMDLIQLDRISTLSAGQISRRDYCYEDMFVIGNDWYGSQTASYVRPFMVGIWAHALIMYYELVLAEARVLSAVEAAANYIWDNCYDEATKSMRYTDRDIGNPDDPNPSPDLNMMIAPMYAWLWSITNNLAWKTKAELLFEGAFPHYDGDGFWISGAYLGSWASPSGKQYNQQLIWAEDYFRWIESNPTPQPLQRMKPTRSYSSFALVMS